MIPFSNIVALSPYAEPALLDMARAFPGLVAAGAVIRDAPVMRIDNAVAVIPIRGILTKRSNLWSRIFGDSTYESIRNDIGAALDDKAVKQIMLDVDSPGGDADGVDEAAETIYQARQIKRVTARVDGMAASAAYWMASQADKIEMSAMDMVGSIGVRMLVYDWSKMFEEAGIKAIPIDTGEYKSAGAMGTPLTENQQQHFQDLVDGMFAQFKSAVARGRGMSKSAVNEVADGRMFLGSDAKAAGLVDSIRKMAIAPKGKSVGKARYEYAALQLLD